MDFFYSINGHNYNYSISFSHSKFEIEIFDLYIHYSIDGHNYNGGFFQIQNFLISKN